MKNTIKLLLCVLTLGVMATAPMLRAQDDKAPPAEGQGGGKKGGKGGRGMMSPEQRLAAIDKAVTLTDEQKTKVTAILEKAQTDMQALAPEDRRTKGMDIMRTANSDIRALLTDDQKKKFDDMPQPGRGGGKKKDSGN